MNMPSNHNLDDRIRRALDESASGLDGATVSRLNQARQVALETGRLPRRNRWLIPLGGLATAAALVLAVTVALRTPSAPLPTDLMSDLELVASEDYELLEDLDFYLWLEAELEESG